VLCDGRQEVEEEILYYMFWWCAASKWS